jgi:hypothetical protein
MSSALNAMSQWPRQAYLAEREWATAGAAVAVTIAVAIWEWATGKRFLPDGGLTLSGPMSWHQVFRRFWQ